MPAPASTPELIELVRKSGLVRGDTLDELTTTPLPPDPTKAAGVLVTRRLLTAFQAKLLLVGRYKGFRLGPYVLTELLGRGGMGAVYKAEHEILRKTVAVKVLTDHKDQLTRERFHREARAAAALDHPNIVRTHDVGRDGDAHYLVMEYVDGQTLDQVVAAGGPLGVTAAADVIAQAAAGLQHAHERGFLHRDIKPGNLIRTPDGTVKLLDMGLARSMDKTDELTAHLDKGAIVGTADYISPEQVMNDPKIDIRSDIYSLGATFYALLAGRPLFAGSTVSKLAQHQMKAPTLSDLGAHVPPELRAIVARMIAKKPADRFQTPADVVAALDPWRSGAPPVTPRPTRSARPKWPLWTAVGVTAVAIGVVLAFAFAKGTNPPVAGKPAPAPAPPVAPPVLPPVPTADPEPLFRLDTALLKPFRQTKGVGDAGLPTSKTGLPKGVGFLAFRKGATGEFAAVRKDGGMVLAVANKTPELSAQFFFQLEGELGVRLEDEEKYRMTVEYATEPGAKASAAIQTEKYKTVRHLDLPDTKGEWRTMTATFVRPADTPLRATFDNQTFTSADAPAWVYLRRFEIAPTP